MSVNYDEEVKAAKRMLHTVKYDRNTTYFDPKEQMYWMKFLSGDPMIGDYIRSQIRHNPQLRREILNQPVCGKCEGFTFYHKGGAQCPTCGTWTPEGKTHKVKEHLRGGHYR